MNPLESVRTVDVPDRMPSAIHYQRLTKRASAWLAARSRGSKLASGTSGNEVACRPLTPAEAAERAERLAARARSGKARREPVYALRDSADAVYQPVRRIGRVSRSHAQRLANARGVSCS